MRLSVAMAVACLSISILSAAEPAQAAVRQSTHIPAQGLGSALQALAKQRTLQVVYLSDAVDAMKTQGASGELTSDEALKQLLSGTGLAYRYLDETTVTVYPADGPRAMIESAVGEGGVAAVGAEAIRSAQSSSADDPQSTDKRKSLWQRIRLAQSENSDSSDDKKSESSSESPAGDSGDKIEKLEEIVVTAQKREERLQDVPMPVTAISVESLVNSHQLRLQDYYAKVPGLSLNIDGGRGGSLVALRGITTGFANPTVAILVDDVPYGPSTLFAGGWTVIDIDPSELARVEVLRGPQGTLYGASSLGGLIKYVTVDPSLEGVSGHLSGGFTGVSKSDDMGHHVRGSVNVPIGESWALRASAYTRRDPGFIDDPVLGIDDVNGTEAQGGRVSALWRPSQDFSLKLNALLQDDHRDGSPSAFIQPGFEDLQQSYARRSAEYDRKIEAYSANVKAKLGILDLTSMTGYNVTRSNGSFDLTWVFGQLTQDQFGVTGTPWVDDIIKTTKFTQEIRLSAPIGERLEWLVGAFYLDDKSDWNGGWVATDFFTGVQVGDWLDQHEPSTFTEYSAFTNLTFHVTDRFDFQIGGRQSENKQKFSPYSEGIWITEIQGLPSPFIHPVQRIKDSAFTYLLTPQFKISPDLMVYARLASGYRPGGGNGANTSGLFPASYAPDTTQNYEIGFKGELLGRALSVDASLYYIDWKDIQVTLLSTGGGAYIDNVARAKSQGAELAVESRPLSGLTIAGWVAWNDAKVTEIPINTLFTVARGDQLPYSSRFSGHVSLDKEFPLSNRLLGFVNAAVSYVDDRPSGFPFGSTLRTRFPSYAKTDARLGVKYDSWTVDLFVNNLADKRGILTGGATEGNPVAFTFIQPRTIGLSFTKTYP